MKTLEPILTGTRPPGIYRLRSRAQPARILKSLGPTGWHSFYIDGKGVATKTEFLQAAAASMNFPAYFSHNWDAFEECIQDLHWAPAPGYVLLYDRLARFAAHQPDQWRIAHAILADAIAAWAKTKTPFYVLLRHTGRSLPQVETL